MTKHEALARAMKLCSVKEYAPSEVGQKLLNWGLTEEEADTILNTLKEEKFLDEFRMARYYANDKFRFNKWGKIKIKFMLLQKKLSHEAINQALDQINEQEYLTVLKEEIAKKRKTIKDTDEYHIRAKLFQFVSGRGFEPEAIHKVLKEW